MKKILSLLLAMMLVLSMAACGGNGGAVSDAIGGALENAVEDAIDSAIDEAIDRVVGDEADEAPNDTPAAHPDEVPPEENENDELLDEAGWYYTAEEVSLYLVTYGYLPGNFITKDEARDLGWEGGSVEKFAPGCAIGGDKFGNREGLLPKASGRQYYECDINTNGTSSRGPERLVFSDDGLIYYTADHYENFTLLYGEE